MRRPGETVGKFVLEGLLGRGGGGEVWRARDTALGRPAALKFLSDASDEERARFRRESRALASLGHPGIVQVFETGEHDGQPFIAMELVEGSPPSAPLAPREAARLVRDAARALQFAHERGIVHRDVKPSNLLVGGDGRVRVADFGLARNLREGSSLTASGMAVGTPAYMSPEQAKGEVRAVDARSDVYGLGATLYQLLAGRPPFQGRDAREILVRVVEEDAAPTGAERDLDAVALKCLEKEPSRRYASAEALARELDRWLAGQGVEARPRGRRLGRRRGLLAGIALAGFAALAAATMLRGRAADRARAALLEEMRRTSRTCLEAALDLRRAGDIRGMTRYAAELEAVCRRVEEEMPGLAEPVSLRGRMYRAQLRMQDALAAQEEALRRDPGYGPARYERAAVRVFPYLEEYVERWQAWTRRRPAAPGDVRRRLPRQGEIGSPQLALLRGRILDDLRGSGAPLGPALEALVLETPDAAERIRAALEADPHDEVAWICRGALILVTDGPGPAVAWLTEAIDRDRGSAQAWTWRAVARMQQVALRTLPAGDRRRSIEDSVADLAEAVRLSPSLASAWRELAGARIELGRALEDEGLDAVPVLEIAINNAHRAAELDAGNAESLLALGTVRMNRALAGREEREGRLRSALADLEAALRLMPDEVEIRVRRAQCMALLAREMADGGEDGVPLARESLRQLETIPKARGLFHNRGAVLQIAAVLLPEGAQALDRLIAEATVEVDADPLDVVARLERAYALADRAARAARTGSDGSADLEAALADARTAAELDPTNHRACLASVLIRLQRLGGCGRDAAADLELAGAEVERAMRLCPTLAETWRAQGALLAMRAGRALARPAEAEALLDQADESLREALKRNPRLASALCDRGRVAFLRANVALRRGGSPEPFLRAAVEALSEGAAHPRGMRDVRLLRGSIRLFWAGLDYRREGLDEFFALAVGDFEAVLRSFPEDVETLARRANAFLLWSDWAFEHGRDAVAPAEAAVADYDALVGRRPEAVEPLLMRGSAEAALARSLRAAGGDASAAERAAEEDFAKVLELAPGHAEALARRGQARFQRGAWRDALADFEEAVRREPAREPPLRAMIEESRRRAGQ